MLLYRAKNLHEIAQEFERRAELSLNEAKGRKGVNRAFANGEASAFQDAAAVLRATKFVRRSKKEA